LLLEMSGFEYELILSIKMLHGAAEHSSIVT
jgi:hypothetical protein